MKHFCREQFGPDGEVEFLKQLERKQILAGPFILNSFPDSDGDMEIEMDDSTPCSCISWIERDDVLRLVKGLIDNFEFTEEDLNGSTD